MNHTPDQHESPIKTPQQLILAVVAAFVIPIVCIVLLVKFVTSATLPAAGSNAQSPEAIAARIQPVAEVGYSFKDATAPKVLLAGEAVFKSVCIACHGAGVAGAPKFGDPAAWAPRIKQGYETIVGHAIHGLNAMPAKGGNADLDDLEVARAVVYIVNHSGGNFKEPEVAAGK